MRVINVCCFRGMVSYWYDYWYDIVRFSLNFFSYRTSVKTWKKIVLILSLIPTAAAYTVSFIHLS